MIYFDNGATSYPKPLAVRKAVSGYFNKYGANPGRGGHNMAMATASQVFHTREKLGEFFGCEASEVVFTLNCTHSNNIVIAGLLKEGDHVIISDMEHNSVLRPIHRLASKGIITYSIATTYEDNNKTIDSISNLIRANTKLIIMIHGSNVTGQVLPVNKIGRLCKEKGILFMVDGAQTAGVLDIDVVRDNIDFLTIAAHKGLFATTGTGVLIAKGHSHLDAVFTGGTGSVSTDFIQPDFMPDKLESGTANTLGIISLGAGIDFINTQSREALYNKEHSLGKYLYDNLSKIGNIIIYSPNPAVENWLPVISFNIGNISSEIIGERLNAIGIATRCGLHCAPLCHEKLGTFAQGTVRISLSPFNNKGQINFLLENLKKIINTL